MRRVNSSDTSYEANGRNPARRLHLFRNFRRDGQTLGSGGRYKLSNRIDGSAWRLFGREKQGPGFYQSWSAEGVSGFDECPEIRLAKLAEVACTPQPPATHALAPDERASQAVSLGIGHVTALMAKLLERTCQVRNRLRQSRTLGCSVPGELAEGRG